MKIGVDYDRRTGKFAVWVREHAAPLSIVLVLLGMLISTLGHFSVIHGLLAYFLRIGLGVFTIATIVVGFEVVAFEHAGVTTDTTTNMTETTHTSDDKSDK